jgi:riboflavin biosynthesis pyrimidine reductase
MRPMRTLLEQPVAGPDLPPALAELYGGGLGLDRRLLYANAVTSLDGVVAIGGRRGSGSLISGRDEADRFVMGLLRAHADAVLVGAGTLRAEGGQPWTAARISPAHAAAYRQLGRPDPWLVVVSASGAIDPGDPALEAGGLILTTEAGAAGLRGRLPALVRVRTLPDGPFRGAWLVAAVRAEGHRRVLAEGGPRLFAALAADGALDELFLTVSPILAGRRRGDDRQGLLEGAHLLGFGGGERPWLRLRSLKAHGSHLFCRYVLTSSATRSAPE